MNDPKVAASSGSVGELVRQIESLWESGQNPDPDSLLEAAGVSLPAEVAKVLATDQWHRWHAGERLAVEHYFARHPAVEVDPEAALLLIYGEFLVREERGEEPSPGEYRTRFPRCAAALARQLHFHAAVEQASVRSSVSEETSGEPAAMPPFSAAAFPGSKIPNDARLTPSSLETDPVAIDRYRFIRRLGQGGFARVDLGRVHGLRSLGLAILIALVAWGGSEGYGYLRARALVDWLRTANIRDVPARIEQLRSYRRWADRPLAGLLASTANDRDQHLRASLARLALWPGDRGQADSLYDRLLGSSPVELPVIWGILRKHDPGIEQRLRSFLDDENGENAPRFRAACALANTDSAQLEKSWNTLSPFITDEVLTTVVKHPGEYATLIETLRPVRKALLTPLARVFRDAGRPENERNFATTILIDYASDDPRLLADLLMDAGPESYASLFPVAEQQAPGVLPVLRAEIAKSLASANAEGSEEVKDRLAQRQARAAIALVRLGYADEVWPLLQHRTDPRLRNFIVNWLNPLGTGPKPLAAELARLHISASATPRTARRVPHSGTQKMDAILFHPETSIRRALILTLGTYGSEGLAAGGRESLIPRLLDLYRHDPDAGIHSSAEWVLRQWKQEHELEAAAADLSQLKDRRDRRWFVNSRRQTFVIIEGPVAFRMGSPMDEPDRSDNETPHRRVIRHRFAIATKEVTVEQYEEFVKENPGVDHARNDRYSLDPKGPMNEVTWYHAVAYCNWLSQQDGLPRDQWCYLPNERDAYDKGMKIPADILRRTGYRLPTEAEWEYSSRAGAMTSRHYGFSNDLLEQYARYNANSHNRAWPCGSLMPNDLGLFDTLGNVLEWCQDRHRYQRSIADSSVDDVIDDAPRLLRGAGFAFQAADVRSAHRGWVVPTTRNIYYGFRLARTDK